MLELQRRVLSDPAPFVFAQLAEEYRRSGRFADAVASCREGLARHPGYLSARLILGRALAALSSWDESAREYEQVVRHAPDNLAATRELAEICERLGRTHDALTYYSRALALARNDRALETAIQRLSAEAEVAKAPDRTVPPPLTPAAAPAPAPKASVRQVDFDAVLALLGRPHQQPPPLTERLLSDPLTLMRGATAVAELPVAVPADDAMATLERGLRDRFAPADAATPKPAPAVQAMALEEGPPAGKSTPDSAAARIETAVITALEAWLDAIARDRHQTRQL